MEKPALEEYFSGIIVNSPAAFFCQSFFKKIAILAAIKRKSVMFFTKR